MFTTGLLGPRSMPNMAFTPSVENWLRLLDQLPAMDVDRILPAHGDVSTAADVKELAAMIADEYAAVKDAVAKGLTADEAAKALTLPQTRVEKLCAARRLDHRQAELFRLTVVRGTTATTYRVPRSRL